MSTWKNVSAVPMGRRFCLSFRGFAPGQRRYGRFPGPCLAFAGEFPRSHRNSRPREYPPARSGGRPPPPVGEGPELHGLGHMGVAPRMMSAPCSKRKSASSSCHFMGRPPFQGSGLRKLRFSGTFSLIIAVFPGPVNEEAAPARALPRRSLRQPLFGGE